MDQTNAPTPDAALVDRLAALPGMAEIPREELEWLVAHGTLETAEVGEVLAPAGLPIEKLWILLSGCVAVRVDRGSGPRIVTEWRAGDVTGMLPYSRMSAPPGDNFVAETSEALVIHVSLFPEMTHRCPEFTAYTVHSMLDRARSFRASDLQDEKLASLGKLAAGLAHELNNPAAAAVRSAKRLVQDMNEADAAARELGAVGLSDEMLREIESVRTACLSGSTGAVLSPLDQADREDAMMDWLEDHDLDPAHAVALAATTVGMEDLDRLAETVPNQVLAAAVRWVATGCATRSLATDIEQAATRISDLVAAIKRFTFMDNTAVSARVDVGAGLRDTIRIVASKARAKGASVDLDIEPDLPRVHATGGELNQVWLNLIDNALDAISGSGRVEIGARSEGGRVVVSISDDGGGIPEEVLPHIFDPFYTTKPPGEGTGLGLDITRRLLQQHRGVITVQSEPGRTEFRVSLPAAED